MLSSMSGKKRPVYPFSAIVGQESMKEALILNTINPLIGGVLIRGEKGTAKSTAVRALADLLPEREVVQGCACGCQWDRRDDYCPDCVEKGESDVLTRAVVPMRVVELPLSSTEDRVAGTLDIEHAISTGRKKFEPGVLAKANGNILYVDEVNLLDDHIVDLLLDAAAMGVNHIEREGISYSHPSRFILVGTMNPEEGDLRPQLLDRFGLCVNVIGIDDPEVRLEIILRRAEFESDQQAFIEKWSKEDEAISERIMRAQELLPQVKISRDMLRIIVDICIRLGVDGHRGDITMMKTSSTIAALAGRTEVNEQDIREAAALVLAHRMRRTPFDDPETDEKRIEDAVDDAIGKDVEPPEQTGSNSPDGSATKNFKANDPFA